jgi:hypothetical protein
MKHRIKMVLLTIFFEIFSFSYGVIWSRTIKNYIFNFEKKTRQNFMQNQKKKNKTTLLSQIKSNGYSKTTIGFLYFFKKN